MFRYKYIVILVALMGFSSIQAEEIKIVYANQWPPYSEGDGGQVSGILPTLIDNLLSKQLNHQVKHIGVPWNRAQEMVRLGIADGFITAKTDSRLSFSDSSAKSLHKIKFQAFVLKNSSAEKVLKSDLNLKKAGKSLKFCDVYGNGWANQFYKQKEISHHMTPTILNCLKMLKLKRQDVVIHSADVVESVIKRDTSLNVLSKIPHLYEKVDFYLLMSKKSKLSAKILAEVDKLLE